MLKLLVIVFISVAVIQVSAAETKPGIPTHEVSSLNLTEPRVFILAEMTKKVLKLKLDALKIEIELVSNINVSKKQIASIVKVSLDNVRDQVNDLEAEVRNATAQAKQKRKSIWSCVRKEKRSQWWKVRSGRILKCKKSISFDVLKVNIAALAAVKVEALSYIPTCLVLHPLSNKNLKKCIQNNIDDAYSKIDLIKTDIRDAAADIYLRASNCIEDNLGDLDLDIEQISIDFKRCVQHKLKIE